MRMLPLVRVFRHSCLIKTPRSLGNAKSKRLITALRVAVCRHLRAWSLSRRNPSATTGGEKARPAPISLVVAGLSPRESGRELGCCPAFFAPPFFGNTLTLSTAKNPDRYESACARQSESPTSTLGSANRLRRVDKPAQRPHPPQHPRVRPPVTPRPPDPSTDAAFSTPRIDGSYCQIWCTGRAGWCAFAKGILSVITSHILCAIFVCGYDMFHHASHFTTPAAPCRPPVARAG